MSNFKSFVTAVTVMMAALSVAAAAFAADNPPMTPELAAKRELVRKQEEQRLTPAKRKAAAEALRAERLKVYNAKKAVQQANPGNAESK